MRTENKNSITPLIQSWLSESACPFG